METVKEYIFVSGHKEEAQPGVRFDHVVLAHNFLEALGFLADTRMQEKPPPEEMVQAAELAPWILEQAKLCCMHYYCHRDFVVNEIAQGENVKAGTVFTNRPRTLSS